MRVRISRPGIQMGRWGPKMFARDLDQGRMLVPHSSLGCFFLFFLLFPQGYGVCRRLNGVLAE